MGTTEPMIDHIGTESIDVPVFFPEPEKQFFGFVSMPRTSPPSTTGVILLSGSFGGTTTLGRNRMWLKMARSLADRGYPVLRFDYAGIGYSVGELVCCDLDRPALSELAAGFDVLADHGAERFIVVGTCYGSRTALEGTVGDPRIAAVHLLVPPVRDVTKGQEDAEHLAEYVGAASLAKKAITPQNLRKLVTNKQSRRAARRVLSMKARSVVGRGPRRAGSGEAPQGRSARDASLKFQRPLRALLEGGVPVRLLFGDADPFFTEFQEARAGRLGEFLDQHHDLVDVEIVSGKVRGFLTVSAQDASIRSVVDWVERQGG